MGPTIEVISEKPIADEQLLAIDSLLSSLASSITRTGKGKVWTVWIDKRPIEVSVTDSSSISLAAGLNSKQDYEILTHLGERLASLLNGVASEPTK